MMSFDMAFRLPVNGHLGTLSLLRIITVSTRILRLLLCLQKQ